MVILANEPYHNIISVFHALSIHIDGKGIYQTIKHYQQIKYENFLSRQHTVFTLGYKNRLKQIVPMSKHGRFFFLLHISFKHKFQATFVNNFQCFFLFKAKRTINWTRVEVFLCEICGKKNDKIQYWLPLKCVHFSIRICSFFCTTYLYFFMLFFLVSFYFHKFMCFPTLTIIIE